MVERDVEQGQTSPAARETDGPQNRGRDEFDLAETYLEAFTAMPAPLVILDTALNILDANDAYLLMLDLRRADLIGRYLFEVFPASAEAADDAASAEGVLRAAITTGTSQHLPVFQYDTETSPGSGDFQRRWWQMTATPLMGDVLATGHPLGVPSPPGASAALAALDAPVDARDPAGRRVFGVPVARAVLYRLDEVTQTVLEQRRAAAAEAAATAVAAREARLAQVVETMASAFFTLDHSFRFTYLNRECEGVLGATRDQLLGQVVWDAYPALVATPAQQAYFRAAATGQVTTYENYYPEPLNSWFEGSVHPAPDGVAVYLREVSDRHAAEAARDLAAARLQGLAQAALAIVEAGSVPELARIVAERGLHLLGADGGALAVPDPDHRGSLRSYISARFGPDTEARYSHLALSEDLPVCRAAVSGQAVLLPDAASSVAFSSQMAQVNSMTGCQAWVSIPLRATGEPLGVLTAGWAQPQELDAEQLALVEAFASQCAQALQRLRALEAERAASAVTARFSETLQRSLLSDPAQPDGLQVAVRYAPATADAEVGGDWYDAFTTADGTTSIVIGDVTGHDMAAAAAMGQLRNLTRGIGYAVGQPPAAVMTTLDRAAAAMGLGVVATAVLAQVAHPNPPRPATASAHPVEEVVAASPPSPATAQDGETSSARSSLLSVSPPPSAVTQPTAGTRLLRWSNAGHLPPLLITPQGAVSYLEAASDLVLGCDPDTARHDHEVLLAPGSVVLLYTDGLIERRRVDLQQGLAWLTKTVREHAAVGPVDIEQLCDVLLAAVQGHLQDDVALLALQT